MSNVLEMSSDGCLRLVLTLILTACEKGDKDFLRSDKCIKLLDYIPTSMLQNALDRDVVVVGAKELSNQLIKKVDNGDFKIKKPKDIKAKVRRVWKVIHPCKFEEETDNLKEFADDVGVSYQALLNVANEPTRHAYKGYQVRRIT